MSDGTEYDVVAHAVDDGVQDMLNKQASSMDEFSRSTENASEKAEKQTSALDNAKMSMTELNSGISLVKEAYAALNQVYDETIAKSMSYVQTIHDLSTVSGQSMETTSRMVQVLDDWKISTDDIGSSMRKLTANELAPNIDTIATLSDKYLAITDVEERNKFVMDNLGVSGRNWNQVLAQGGDALRAQAAAVDENLIATQKMYEQSEQLRLAQDNLSDTLEGLKIKIGSDLTPVMANWITVIDKMSDSQQSATTNFWLTLSPLGGLLNLTGLYSQANEENKQKLIDVANAEKNKAAATTSSAAADKAAKEAADALSRSLQTEISLTGSIQSQMSNYENGLKDVAKGMSEDEAKIKTLISQGYSPLGKTVMDVRDHYSELSAKSAELAAENGKAMDKMRIDNLQAKLSVDGISEADYNLIISEQLKAGIITQAAAAEAVAMNTLNEQLANNKITQKEYDDAIANGSLVVKGASDKNAESFDAQGKAVTKNTDEGSAKVKQLATDTADAAAVTKSSTEQMSGSWGTAADSVSNSIDGMIAKIQEYINKIGSIPAIPAPNTGDAAQGGSVRATASAAASTIMHVIDVRVNGAHQEFVTIL